MSEREPLRITRRTTLKWAALAAAAPALGGLPLDVFAAGDSAVLLWNEAWDEVGVGERPAASHSPQVV